MPAPKALFLHIPKTAGTSIVKAARENLPPSEIISHADFLEKGSRQIEGSAFISGHFGYAFAAKFMTDRFSFTFLRDPIERVLSFYHFARHADANAYEVYRLAQIYDLEEFVGRGCEGDPAICESIWNHQARLLSIGWEKPPYDRDAILGQAIDNLRRFSYVGFTETLETDYRNIGAALGWATNKPAPRELSNPGRPTRKDISSTTLQQIARLTELDSRLYAWARQLRGEA